MKCASVTFGPLASAAGKSPSTALLDTHRLAKTLGDEAPVTADPSQIDACAGNGMPGGLPKEGVRTSITRENRPMTIVPAPLRFALALLSQLVVAMPLAADDGDADPTFADGGQMSFVVAAPADVGNRILAITALADGALLATGFARTDATGLDVAVARITADGVLDPGFGDLGVAVFDFAGHETMRQLSVEPDGRILLAGDRNSVHALVRLSAQGDLDTTFGSGGLAEIANPWPAASVGLGPLSIRSDSSRVYFAGLCKLCPDNAAWRPYVLAVTRAGVADPSFGDDGWAVVPMNVGTTAPVFALDLDGSGRPIVAVGDGSTPLAFWRLTQAGQPDPAWGGGDGRADSVHKMTGPLQLLVAADGARLYAYNSTQVRAFLPGGAVDPAFGGGLAVPLDGFENDSRINRFVLQDDGKLLGAGWVQPDAPGYEDMLLLRLGTDGSLDPAFHGGGYRRVPFDLFAGARDMAYALTLSVGRPVMAGSAQTLFDAASHWAVVRTENGLIFADDFDDGSTAAWAGQ